MIKLYTVTDCENCKKAKALLDKLNIAYEEYNLREKTNREVRAHYRKLGATSAPIIISEKDGEEDWILIEYDEETLLTLLEK